MGYEILEQVIASLIAAGIHAELAYPGQRTPWLERIAAAVHLLRVDRANLLVTVEVNVICPASMGGTACEVEAILALDVLGAMGARCVQRECSYDGDNRVYVVPVEAEFDCMAGSDYFKPGRGFTVTINEAEQPNVTAFTSWNTAELRMEYSMGQSAPVAASRKEEFWGFEIEELTPQGLPETAETEGTFLLEAATDGKAERFRDCHWTQCRRELTSRGVKRIRTGTAMTRELVENGRQTDL